MNKEEFLTDVLTPRFHSPMFSIRQIRNHLVLETSHVIYGLDSYLYLQRDVEVSCSYEHYNSGYGSSWVTINILIDDLPDDEETLSAIFLLLEEEYWGELYYREDAVDMYLDDEDGLDDLLTLVIDNFRLYYDHSYEGSERFEKELIELIREDVHSNLDTELSWEFYHETEITCPVCNTETVLDAFMTSFDGTVACMSCLTEPDLIGHKLLEEWAHCVLISRLGSYLFIQEGVCTYYAEDFVEKPIEEFQNIVPMRVLFPEIIDLAPQTLFLWDHTSHTLYYGTIVVNGDEVSYRMEKIWTDDTV